MFTRAGIKHAIEGKSWGYRLGRLSSTNRRVWSLKPKKKKKRDTNGVVIIGFKYYGSRANINIILKIPAYPEAGQITPFCAAGQSCMYLISYVLLETHLNSNKKQTKQPQPFHQTFDENLSVIFILYTEVRSAGFAFLPHEDNGEILECKSNSECLFR